MLDAKTVNTIPPVGPGEIRQLLDAKACRCWLLGKLHASGATCPACGMFLSNPRQLDRFWELATVRCSECQRSFNAFSGTPFHRIQLDPVDIVLLLLLLRLRCGAPEVAELLGVDERTVRRWQKRYSGHAPDISPMIAGPLRGREPMPVPQPGEAFP